MGTSLATYYAKLLDMPDSEYKVEILEDGPIKKIAVNGKIYEVDYNMGGDSIHSIIIDHHSHGVQISPSSNNSYRHSADLVKIIAQHNGRAFSSSQLNHRVTNQRLAQIEQAVFYRLAQLDHRQCFGRFLHNTDPVFFRQRLSQLAQYTAVGRRHDAEQLFFLHNFTLYRQI